MRSLLREYVVGKRYQREYKKPWVIIYHLTTKQGAVPS